MITLEQVIDDVMQLSLPQQEMLLEIIHRRHIENRRKEMAMDVRVSIAAFQSSSLKPQSVQEIIAELQASLSEIDEVY